MEASNSTNFLAQNTILIILLYTASTITFISALPKTNVEFIKSSCSFTTYPTLCVSSLSTRAGAIQTSPKLLAQTALSVTLDTTRSTSTAIVKLSQMHGMAPPEVAAMKDCIELLGDLVYELENSLKEMSRRGSKSSHLLISDLQTWVSAAMTNEDTCIEGFVNTKMKNVVRGKIVNVAHLTSNALALINSYANFCKQAFDNLLYTLPQLTLNSSRYSPIVQTSPKLLVQTDLSITLDTTSSTSSIVKVYGMAPRKVATLP
ncbi:hypothetical protein OSB04_017282 [Centaurea solstitialis]|uniref:pectinesterase n=1 Tax=Centaurea solstitialis TaxID=347529 RepID=A0AA38W9B8_9ASTR|nr:hypothetical protein OSB04_017282 [Centaurea solstitialis]